MRTAFTHVVVATGGLQWYLLAMRNKQIQWKNWLQVPARLTDTVALLEPVPRSPVETKGG